MLEEVESDMVDKLFCRYRLLSRLVGSGCRFRSLLTNIRDKRDLTSMKDIMDECIKSRNTYENIVRPF